MKESDTRQLELGCGVEEGSLPIHPSDEELMRRIDKLIDETISNVRPYLNRMVKEAESLLEGSFIRTPQSNVLDDLIEGLEEDIRKFVNEVRALKRWSQPNPPHSSSSNPQ